MNAENPPTEVSGFVSGDKLNSYSLVLLEGY